MTPFAAMQRNLGPSGGDGGHQPFDTHDIEHSPQIVGKRGEGEFGADLAETAHQERALVHPLLD